MKAIRRRIKLHKTHASTRGVRPSVTFNMSIKVTNSAPKVSRGRTVDGVNGKPRVVLCSTSVISRGNLHSLMASATSRLGVPCRFSTVTNNKASSKTVRIARGKIPSLSVAVTAHCVRSRTTVLRHSSCRGTIGLVTRIVGGLSRRAISEVAFRWRGLGTHYFSPETSNTKRLSGFCPLLFDEVGGAPRLCQDFFVLFGTTLRYLGRFRLIFL